jgi:ribose transport system ATP-binding protein
MTLRLRTEDVRKNFGATSALRGVSFEVQPGEVHALIGENGAGKSTLMKILSGVLRPDAGVVELDGLPFAPAGPLEARRRGVAMIHQELTLAPHLSVEANILLGAEPSRFGWIDRARSRERARAALAELHHEGISLDAATSSLPIAEQQVVEIARALCGNPRVLIMDEPTSSLTAVDTENLFRVIGRLRAAGVSVIYISHFLEECQRVADRYTVLRDGQSVGSGDMRGAELGQLIRLMVGRDMQDIFPRSPRTPSRPVLEWRRLAGVTRPRSASLTLRAGEILGLAGLVGAGRTEALRACFGLDRITGGVVVVHGRDQTRATPARRLASGIGLLSENRKEEGLMLERSVADNLTLSKHAPFTRAGWISRARQNRLTEEWMARLGVRARHPGQPIRELSGGNQQKVAIGRLLHHDAAILLLDEPTRGVDIGSKAQIYRLMNELAERGKAVIFVSSYLPELLGVCDTIGVMSRGVLTDVRPSAEWTEHSLMAAAIGQPAAVSSETTI